MTDQDRAALIERKQKRIKWLHEQTAIYISEAKREERELELLRDPANDQKYVLDQQDGFPF